jgi:hypothetical protein
MKRMVISLDRIREFNTSGIEDVKIVLGRYIKYKREGKWHRTEIKNFDRYSKPAYKIMEILAKNLFIDVKWVEEKVPLFCEQNGQLCYFPTHFAGRKFLAKDKVLIAEKLNPLFLKKYPKLSAEATKLTILHVGNGQMLFIYEYEEDEEESNYLKLINDMANLQTCALQLKLSEPEIVAIFKEYFRDLFAPTTTSAPQEKTIEVQTPLQSEVKQKVEEVENRQSFPKVEEKVEKKEELLSLEKIRKLPYEEVKKVAEEFNPPASEFFARAAKIEYEIALSKIKNEAKRREADYVLYWFIAQYEKETDKKKLLSEFYKNIRGIA